MSRAVARMLHVGAVQLDILDSLQLRPLATHELAQQVGDHAWRIRQRLQSLLDRGLVLRHDNTWRISELGYSALHRARRVGRSPGVPGTPDRAMYSRDRRRKCQTRMLHTGSLQLDILDTLASLGPLNREQVLEETGALRPSCNRALLVMCRRGLLRIEVSRYHVTDLGRTALGRAVAAGRTPGVQGHNPRLPRRLQQSTMLANLS